MHYLQRVRIAERISFQDSSLAGSSSAWLSRARSV
ncbi:Glutamine transport ATP-binding protein GlnQ|nr:Glutamine transport ATP-binding protein GlnQ [Candidatus Pantoea persica]